MRVLLDESLPRPLGRLLIGLAVQTVGQAGWASFKNGVLLQLAASDFDVLITADQNIEFQQNLETLPLAVVVLWRTATGWSHSSRWFPRSSIFLPFSNPRS